jgi:squalene-hopene/tetraprenyl-beta-curcumene cyclase
MTLSRLVRLAPKDGHDEVELDPALDGSPSSHPLAAPLRRAILRTRQWLVGEQHADGYWEGELEGDTILESEYILLLAYLRQEKSERAKRCAQYLLEKQTPEGGWAMYPGG